MGFYNRGAGQQVQKFVDQSGNVEPLDVVSYGGSLLVTGVLSDGNAHNILAAPPAGFSWALHMVSFFVTTTAVASLQLLGLTTSGLFFVAPGGTNPDITGQLDGQIVNEGLSVQAAGATGSWRYTLTYDQVIAPQIR